MVSKHYSESKISPVRNSATDDKLQQGSFEHTIYILFKIDLLRLINNEVALCKNFHIQPSELERKPYWEYEYFIEAVNNNIKEENERAEEESSKYGNMNPGSMMKNLGKNMAMPKYSSPTINIPKMPSFK